MLPICDMHYIQHHIRTTKKDWSLRKQGMIPKKSLSVYVIQESFEGSQIQYQVPAPSESDQSPLSDSQKALVTIELQNELAHFTHFFQTTLPTQWITTLSPLRSMEEIERRLNGFSMQYIEQVSKQRGGKQLQLTKVLEDVKDRRHINPPFWQVCNTHQLHEVLSRVFA
jgi:hypothetical protein